MDEQPLDLNQFLTKKRPFSFVKDNPYSFTQKAYGAIGLGAQAANLAQGQNFNPQAPAQQQDAYGRPQYNLGRFASEVQSFKPQGAGIGDLLTGAGQGFAIGGIPGAIGGAAITGIAGAFGADEEARKKKAAQEQLAGAKSGFNKSMEEYNKNFLAQRAYEDQLRMFNMPTNYV